MRITRETLLKLAKDYTEKQLAPDRNVTAVFLVGSVRPEEAALPPVLDVDLLVIYNGEPPHERDIIKLSNEVHLDVSYENAKQYAQPRELRGDPWRGWNLWDPLLLHEKGRFFEYTQAILRSQFDDPENVMKRCRAFSVPAREAWSEMIFSPESASPIKILTAAANAANALASLSGAPLTERNLVSAFAGRAKALELPELTGKLLAILSGSLEPDLVRQALPQWENCFLSSAQYPPDLRIHPARLAYYKTAIEHQLESDLPAASLWPMLHTWALASQNGNLPQEAAAAWQTFCTQVGLSTAEIPARLEALDSFLDVLEEMFEQITAENGLS